MPTAHPTRRYLLWLGLIIVLTLVVYELTWYLPLYLSAPAPEQTSANALPAAFPKNIPPPAPTDYTTAQKGFQYLVSYTDSGFAPRTLAVNKGETVRFTNNSAGTLQLSLAGAPALAHGAYIEHTFDTAGTFTYSAGTQKIAVTVQ